MIRITELKTILLFFIGLAFLFPEKSSKEIQKDLDKKNKEAELLKNEINDLAKQIQKKNNESKLSTKTITDYKQKIDITKEIIELLKKDEKNLSLSISDKQNIIKELDERLINIQQRFSKMVLHLYKTKSDSFLDIFLKSNNWEDMIYKMKYLEILSNQHQNIKLEIKSLLNELDKEILLLTNELLYKKDDIESRNIAINELSKIKNEEQKRYNKIKLNKFELEKEREDKKILLVEMNKMIESLLINKAEAKSREEKLQKIREEKEKQEKLKQEVASKFSNLKGRMPWPVTGNIINDYGVKNSMGVKDRNLWIEIKTNKSEPVKSVFDGIVAKIDFNPVYNSYIIIDHGNGFSTLYANLDDESIQVVDKDYIESQTIIANTLNNKNEMYGVLYFMIFQLSKNDKLINHDPKEWIR